MEKWRVRNKCRQPRLLLSVEKCLHSNALAFIVGSVIGHNAIPSSRVLHERTILSYAFVVDLESANVSIDENNIIPSERPQNLERRVSSVSEIQTSVKLIWHTLLKGKPNRRKGTVAHPSSVKCLFDVAQRNFLHVGYTTDAHFENGISID